LAGALLALAALDQWQFAATSSSADLRRLAQASAVNPADPRAAFRRAQLAKAAGDLATARRELEGILALNPRNSQAQNLLGEVLWRAHDLPAARALYDRMWALYPDDLPTALDRGLLAAEQGDHAAAIASLARAAQLAPSNRVAHLAMAGELTQTNQPEEAIAEYETFLAEFESAPGAAATDGGLPLNAADQADATREYLQAALAQARLLVAQAASAPAGRGGADELARAERRLQRTANIAATQHYFSEAAAALSQLADLQEKLERPGDAAKTRALAAQAAGFAN
jgi:Tfp pilus assembly protein PilF